MNATAVLATVVALALAGTAIVVCVAHAHRRDVLGRSAARARRAETFSTTPRTREGVPPS